MEQRLSVRPAVSTDLTAIDAMLGASYPVLLKPDYPPSVLVTAIPLISKANPKLIASGTYFVALIDDQIVGAGGWTHAAPPGLQGKQGVGHIRHVVTDYRFTRRGIGGALMARVFATAHEANIATLECLSTRTAVRFYEACGFVAGREVAVGLRPGIDFPAVAMTKVLRD